MNQQAAPPWEFYSEANPTHQALVASGKNPSWVMDVQFVTIGQEDKSRVSNLVTWSEEWIELAKSLGVIWGIEPKSKAFLDKLNNEWKNQPIYARWQMEVKEKNGWKNYIKRIEELYPTLAACTAAHDKHRGIDDTVGAMPADAKVNAMPRKQALIFIETWCKNNVKGGVIDEAKLRDFLDSMTTMLGDWEVSDPDVQKIINAVEVPF